MEPLTEFKNGYDNPIQREVLLKLLHLPVIENSFFLTGGTALSVFYLHHRRSNDLDLFSLTPQDFADIDFWIRRTWQQKCAKLKDSPQFLSYLLNETKIEFVIDPLSIREERGKFQFENGHSLMVDTINNIVSNKFCALVSRRTEGCSCSTCSTSVE